MQCQSRFCEATKPEILSKLAVNISVSYVQRFSVDYLDAVSING